MIAGFPDLPSYHQVFLEFLRLRLAQVHHQRNANARDLKAAGRSRDLLKTCIENLTGLIERPELAEDRLAWSSLPIAYDALSRALAELGETQEAQQAKQHGEAIGRRMPDGRKHPWWQ